MNKIVPIEPSREMMQKGCEVTCTEPCYADCERNLVLKLGYKAMLSAAPESDHIIVSKAEYEQMQKDAEFLKVLKNTAMQNAEQGFMNITIPINIIDQTSHEAIDKARGSK